MEKCSLPASKMFYHSSQRLQFFIYFFFLILFRVHPSEVGDNTLTTYLIHSEWQDMTLMGKPRGSERLPIGSFTKRLLF